MRKLWNFHGGVHPPENKQQSNHAAIRQVPLPDTLVLPLSQHRGAIAEPVVDIGQRVAKGEMIAKAQGRISVSLHAPTSGTITAIEDRTVPHPSGMSDACIIIEADGKDCWTSLDPCEDYKQLPPADILNKVRQAGIAGMGGAGFPTEVKLHPPANDKVTTLILNGAECEPYITADDLLMRERASEIVKGIEIMAWVLEPEVVLIGIEDNKPQAIAAMRKAAANTRIEVVVVPTKYPSGGEKQLIKILTGWEVPHGHIPADIGVMCQNVATAAAVYRAIRFGEPLISRITTVAGEAVPECGNYEVLIGTSMAFLLAHAGLKINPDNSNTASQISADNPQRTAIRRLVMGGPMMGFTLPTADSPVIKTTNCLLAASASEFPDPEPEQACIRCGLCAEVCPAELLPQQLYWHAKAEEFDKTAMYNLFDCIECGACSYVCPSSIPLVQYYRFAKQHIRIANIEQQKSDQARERFEFRKLRLERELAEKVAKRKARAEAAAQAQTTKRSEANRAAAADHMAADTETAAAKQAAIVASVQRAQAKRKQSTKDVTTSELAAPAAQVHNSDWPKLRANAEQAKAKVGEAKTRLMKAEASSSPVTEKLRDALGRHQQSLAKAEAAISAAEAAESATPLAITNTEQGMSSKTRPADKRAADTAEPDLNALRQQVSKAGTKLQMMEAMLGDAQQEGDADKMAKLQRAVDKNRERLVAAQAALEDADRTASASLS